MTFMTSNRIEHQVCHPSVKYITEEQLSLLHNPASLIAHPHEDFNYVIVTPCIKDYNNYLPEFYWGDYMSFTDPGWVSCTGVNNQQLLYNLRYLTDHLSDNGCYNVHVFYVSAQNYNFAFMKKENFTYIQLDEYYGEYWSIFTNLQQDYPTDIDYTSKQYHFCNLNRRSDLFRQKWFYKMIDNNQLEQSTIFSYNCYSSSYDHNVDYKLFRKYHYEAGRLDHPDKYISKLPYYVNEAAYMKLDHYDDYTGWRMPNQVYKKSIFCIVNETFFHVCYDAIFTEKIFKPIFCKMPFIIFGCAGSLKKLRSLGFKTFDDIIDESYDLELDNNRRFNMIVKECLRLSNISINDVREMAKKIEPIVIHNRKRLEQLHSELGDRVNQIDKFILTYANNTHE